MSHCQWRDPYVIKDEKTGKYYMFMAASTKEREASNYAGCVGLAVAENIAGPYKVLPPAAAPVVGGTNESPFYEVERPQVIYANGKYHLFFSCWPQGLNPKWVEKMDQNQLTFSSVYWYTSENITGPYIPAAETPIVKGSEKTGLYGTNFIPVPDKEGELLAYGWCPQMHTIEVSLSRRVYWKDDSPEIE